jgi:hypothetical protein
MDHMVYCLKPNPTMLTWSQLWFPCRNLWFWKGSYLVQLRLCLGSGLSSGLSVHTALLAITLMSDSSVLQLHPSISGRPEQYMTLFSFWPWPFNTSQIVDSAFENRIFIPFFSIYGRVAHHGGALQCMLSFCVKILNIRKTLLYICKYCTSNSTGSVVPVTCSLIQCGLLTNVVHSDLLKYSSVPAIST